MNVLLEGIFYNGHGLAEGNRILLRMLHEAGFRVRIEARDADERHKLLEPEEERFISSFESTELTSNDIYLYNWVGSYVRRRPEFRVNIARTTFETDRIPDSWVPVLNSFDEVWVQSTFNRSTFVNSGVRVPIRLIPNFFDTDRYTPSGPVLSLPVEESFRFLSVFDLKRRKGYDVLLDAYLDEFSRLDDVALVVKIRDNNKDGMLVEQIEAHPKPKRDKPPVYIIDQMLSPEELLQLYRACDAFVLPTRGEGWGRPFFEAMLMELPVIGTNWSGQVDFMNSRNSHLVQVDKFVEITDNENPAFIGHVWAEPSKSDLCAKMRWVTRRRLGAKERAVAARKDLLRKFSKKATADKVIGELSKFYDTATTANIRRMGNGNDE
ncbi:glycosyltransferase family 4 protein [Paenibacillus mesophilus]|uniref:glycosyltransferase n=1 Tax=Paenibacillus mesophilus TaxID=2582849 RepID=UPI00110F3390|nr:glycosyltransferase [Paenibacillus mesophilus]TMV53010.1 glycosyltransferase family 4 protein [Paenibacillus mesophilus]